MKKLYRKGTVHPSPPIISDHLSFLPATILTLAAALSADDREVLAYLISSSTSNFTTNKKSTSSSSNNKSCGCSDHDHPPVFNCDCFRCYMSYWVRWDTSPNRQLIHEIIDAFEDHELLHNNNNNTKKKMGLKNNNKKDKKKRSGATGHRGGVGVGVGVDVAVGGNDNSCELQLLLTHESLADRQSLEETDGCGGGGGGEEEERGGGGEEKGPMRSFVSFIGERIWGVWG